MAGLSTVIRRMREGRALRYLLRPNPYPMNDDVELTVVMPCLNEAETIERCIRKAQGWFAESATRGEVVIGDNGSKIGRAHV